MPGYRSTVHITKVNLHKENTQGSIIEMSRHPSAPERQLLGRPLHLHECCLSKQKIGSPGMRIPMLKITHLKVRLIFIMKIPITGNRI